MVLSESLHVFISQKYCLTCVCVCSAVSVGVLNLTGILDLLTRQSHQRLTVKEKIRSTNGNTWCTLSMKKVQLLSAMQKNPTTLVVPDRCWAAFIYRSLYTSEKASIVETRSQKIKWIYYYHFAVPSDTRCAELKISKAKKKWNEKNES